MEQMETAPRLAGCSFGVGGVPFWGKLRASMEQTETLPPRHGCSFGNSGASHWDRTLDATTIFDALALTWICGRMVNYWQN